MHRPFAKYEGLGNDFIVLDGAHWPRAEVSPALARALCDRHTGIGGDGVLWLGEADGAALRLVIFNADGSRPEMCGNGVRCVAAYLFDQARLAVGDTAALATDAGPRPATLLSVDTRGVAHVAVDMGSVRVADEALAVAAGFEAIAADAGNPHAVVFTPAPEEGAAAMAIVRAVEARREVFPHGANVEFVERDDTVSARFRVRVHERGVGWTRACGTGACAVAAVAVARGVHGARAGAPVTVALDGGALEITVARTSAGALTARMAGPARRAFAGTVAAP